MVPLEGLEPPTRDLGRRRSILAELQGHNTGGDRGARTPNLGIANAALSQLSYIPTTPFRRMVKSYCLRKAYINPTSMSRKHVTATAPFSVLSAQKLARVPLEYTL